MASHHAPDTLQRRDAWALRAACRRSDKETFFNERHLATAKAVCQGCPVREECLAEALAVEGSASKDWRFGIYGGLSSEERADLAGGTKAPSNLGRPIAPCGTNSAYHRHVRKREPIDAACRRAHTDAANELRYAGGAEAR